MAKHKIDYAVVSQNMKDMVNLLEFDAMRSAGKAKMNSQHLHSLYFLIEKYDEKAAAEIPAVDPKKVKSAKTGV